MNKDYEETPPDWSKEHGYVSDKFANLKEMMEENSLPKYLVKDCYSKPYQSPYSKHRHETPEEMFMQKCGEFEEESEGYYGNRYYNNMPGQWIEEAEDHTPIDQVGAAIVPADKTSSSLKPTVAVGGFAAIAVGLLFVISKNNAQSDPNVATPIAAEVAAAPEVVAEPEPEPSIYEQMEQSYIFLASEQITD